MNDAYTGNIYIYIYRLLNSFSPGCESPELNSPAPLWNPKQTPYHLKHGPPPPNLTTSWKKLWIFFVQLEVCYTQVSGPVQTTCSNTLSSIHTRHFSHTTMCTWSHKRLNSMNVLLHACALQITLHCSPASCLTYDVSLCTCTVFIWSIRTVSIVCIFLFMYRVTFIYSLFIFKIRQ